MIDWFNVYMGTMLSMVVVYYFKMMNSERNRGPVTYEQLRERNKYLKELIHLYNKLLAEQMGTNDLLKKQNELIQRNNQQFGDENLN